MTLVIPDDKIDNAAKLFIDAARAVNDEQFEATFAGLEVVLDILAKAEIIPLDTKERLTSAIGCITEEEGNKAIEDFFK
ncbi:hypothetical protein D3C87_1070690 [compost metagenome]